MSSGISALERKTDESSVRWPVLEEGTCSSALIIARAGRVCRMISSTTIWDWLSSCVPAFSVCSTATDTVRSCDPSCVCSAQSLRPTPLFRVYALPAPASIRRPSNLSRLQKSNLHAFLTAHSFSRSTTHLKPPRQYIREKKGVAGRV